MPLLLACAVIRCILSPTASTRVELRLCLLHVVVANTWHFVLTLLLSSVIDLISAMVFPADLELTLTVRSLGRATLVSQFLAISL